MAPDSSRIELGPYAEDTGSLDSTVAVYATGVAAIDPLRDALRPWKISHQWHAWSDVDVYTLRAVPFVALIPQVTPAELQAVLRFRQRYPTHPVVLVIEKGAENIRSLMPTGIADVVWWRDIKEQLADTIRRVRDGSFFERLARDIRDIKEQLADTIRRVRDGSFFERLARDIEDAEHLSSYLRLALARAVVCRSPILKVRQLAALVGKDSSTIWRYWKRTADPNHEFRIEDFLDWIILMRAIQRRSAEGAWHFAATAVGVDPRTLSRLAGRLTGLSLREIELQGFAALAAQCHHELLHRMLSPALQAIAAGCNVLSLCENQPLDNIPMEIQRFTNL